MKHEIYTAFVIAQSNDDNYLNCSSTVGIHITNQYIVIKVFLHLVTNCTGSQLQVAFYVLICSNMWKSVLWVTSFQYI